MAQTKIKTLRQLSLDHINSIEFISGRDAKKTVLADDKAMTERQHLIPDKHNDVVIVKTKSATHQISRSNEIRDVIDIKNLKEDHPDIYSQYIRKVEYRKINIKTIKQ